MNGVIHRYERAFQRSTFARFGAVGLLIVYGTLISVIALSPRFSGREMRSPTSARSVRTEVGCSTVA
ncbi:hypothetical protein [Haladaptatus litoreus]|uniref:hypothetical protein n=1 Tax=Haladaptatus litoreus TaxID=553468 RepID=UPI000970DB77